MSDIKAAVIVKEGPGMWMFRRSFRKAKSREMEVSTCEEEHQDGKQKWKEVMSRVSCSPSATPRVVLVLE